FASFPNVTMMDGVPTAVTGTFGAVTAGESATIDFRASQFDAQLQAVNPSATAMNGTNYLSIGAAPAAATDGILRYDADLLPFYVTGRAPNLGTVSYGNPFPSSWGGTLQAGEFVTLTYPLAGTTTPAYAYGAVYVAMPPSAAAAGPIQPLVTPVLSPTIDGQ